MTIYANVKAGARLVGVVLAWTALIVDQLRRSSTTSSGRPRGTSRLGLPVAGGGGSVRGSRGRSLPRSSCGFLPRSSCGSLPRSSCGFLPRSSRGFLPRRSRWFVTSCKPSGTEKSLGGTSSTYVCVLGTWLLWASHRLCVLCSSEDLLRSTACATLPGHTCSRRCSFEDLEDTARVRTAAGVCRLQA
jgi:hypothetical protein